MRMLELAMYFGFWIGAGSYIYRAIDFGFGFVLDFVWI